MFKRLQALPPDPILGIIAAHAADPNPNKIDLGVGVYRDEDGNTPILDSVRRAEKILLDTQTSKTYLGPRGVTGFNDATSELIFGRDSPVMSEGRICTVQTPGGTGALRVAADLVHAAHPDTAVWASDPTWANHESLFPAAGLSLQEYPYYDAGSSSLRFDAMAEALRERGPGDVVLFHACCHNPCGVSPDPQQWQAIANIAASRGFTPMVDIAYMGFERGVEEDTLAVRLLAENCPEVIVASSCSKNFAMYRERAGAISIVAENAQKAADVESVIHSITRKNYSMPPAHGPAVIDIILRSDELNALWRTEIDAMRDRINDLRRDLSQRIAARETRRDFSFLQRQSGMFSFLGLSVAQVQRLRDDFSIYTVNSARINVASFNRSNMDYFVDALVTVLDE
jgi:aspartate aminotransferase